MHVVYKFCIVFAILFFSSPFIIAKKNNENTIKKQIVFTYPKEIYLKIPNPKYEGVDEKKYISTIVQNLLADFLSLQKRVWLFNVSPSSVQYQDYLQENYSYQNFLKSAWFPLKIKKEQEFSIQDFVINITVIYKRTDIINIKTSFFRAGKTIFKQELELAEIELNQEIQKLANNIRFLLSGKESGNLSIISKPSSASVYLDSSYLGQTPLNLKHIGYGSYQLTLKKENFQDLNQNIQINQEQHSFSFDLPLEIGPGSVTIASHPDGAKVYLDNRLLGTTPLILKDLSIGFYRINIYLEEYERYQKDIQITNKNLNHQLDVQLRTRKKMSYEKIVKTNLDAAQAMGYISAGLAITAVAMLINKDSHIEKESRGMYSRNSSAWKKNQERIELFDNLAIGFFIGATSTLISGVAIYINYLNLKSKSQRERTSVQLNATTFHNNSYLSLVVSTKY